jgi:hypothetical protein
MTNKGNTLLVVEDETALRELEVQILGDSGCRVLQAGCAASSPAVETARASGFQSLHLGGIIGFDHALRQRREFAGGEGAGARELEGKLNDFGLLGGSQSVA